jgi:geranylgeranylglycerol-phosphate geranylgeranyltransferase
VALLNSALLYAYAWKLKRGGFTGNVVVSYLVASPFLFGGIAVGGVGVFVTLLLVLCAALANVGREIVKDIEDYEGDKGYAETLPIKIGFKRSAEIAVLFVLLAIAASPLPYIFGLLNVGYITIIALADVFFLYVMIEFLKDVSMENARETQKLIKAGMGIALFAFFVGSF